ASAMASTLDVMPIVIVFVPEPGGAGAGGAPPLTAELLAAGADAHEVAITAKHMMRIQVRSARPWRYPTCPSLCQQGVPTRRWPWGSAPLHRRPLPADGQDNALAYAGTLSAALICAAVMAPGRRMVGGLVVMSRTVDSVPPGDGPASTMRST